MATIPASNDGSNYYRARLISGSPDDFLYRTGQPSSSAPKFQPVIQSGNIFTNTTNPFYVKTVFAPGVMDELAWIDAEPEEEPVPDHEFAPLQLLSQAICTLCRPSAKYRMDRGAHPTVISEELDLRDLLDR
jgi:hypothetical protein